MVVQLMSRGLVAWTVHLAAMQDAHTHNDVELNFSRGALEYLHGGRRVPIGPGNLAMFWGARPHQLIGADDSRAFSWITVPLSVFLRWDISDHVLKSVIAGTIIQARDDEAAETWISRSALWQIDLADTERRRRWAELEVEAFVSRFADALPTTIVESRDDTHRNSFTFDRAGEMARYMEARFTEPLTTGDVADSVHLHPHHATRVFKDLFGIPPGTYLTQTRVAAAARLLITTERSIDDIALAVGFHSISSFYQAFTRHIGTPPGRYRSTTRVSGPPTAIV